MDGAIANRWLRVYYHTTTFASDIASLSNPNDKWYPVVSRFPGNTFDPRQTDMVRKKRNTSVCDNWVSNFAIYGALGRPSGHQYSILLFIRRHSRRGGLDPLESSPRIQFRAFPPTRNCCARVPTTKRKTVGSAWLQYSEEFRHPPTAIEYGH